MKKLPSFLRTRLSAQTATSDHPDADALAAFTESKLTPRERSAVFSHLAQCPECREVVALTAGTAPPIPSPSKHHFMRWEWRLAAMAVTACCIAATIWWPFAHKNKPPSIQPVVETPVPSPSARASAPPVALPQDLYRRIQVPAKTRKLPPIQIPERVEARHLSMPLPPPPPPADSVASAAVPAQAPEVLPQPPSPQTSRGHAEIASKSFGALGGSVARLNGFRSLSRTPDANSNSAWSLDYATKGTVRTSDDGGKTWRSISVDGVTEFYAVSASGVNIWVGGAAGKLFRSMDNGKHWAAIPVMNGTANLSADIVEIDSHGATVKLRTKSEGAWISDDLGANWNLVATH